jgi:hypothetical protein
MLALIEARFLGGGARGDGDGDERTHLTRRDAHASTLEDLFDFDAAPSRDAMVPAAPPPSPTDPGCPFVK